MRNLEQIFRLAREILLLILILIRLLFRPTGPRREVTPVGYAFFPRTKVSGFHSLPQLIHPQRRGETELNHCTMDSMPSPEEVCVG
jgi:hypothetical protein